jgi:hypothetical protein
LPIFIDRGAPALRRVLDPSFCRPFCKICIQNVLEFGNCGGRKLAGSSQIFLNDRLCGPERVASYRHDFRQRAAGLRKQRHRGSWGRSTALSCAMPRRRKPVSRLRYWSGGRPADFKARGFKAILVYCAGTPDGDPRGRCWHYAVVKLDDLPDCSGKISALT